MITRRGLDRLDRLDMSNPPRDAGRQKTSPGGWSSKIDDHISYEVRGHAGCVVILAASILPLPAAPSIPGGRGVQPPPVSNPLDIR